MTDGPALETIRTYGRPEYFLSTGSWGLMKEDGSYAYFSSISAMLDNIEMAMWYVVEEIEKL
jgi:hypothetical protein